MADEKKLSKVVVNLNEETIARVDAICELNGQTRTSAVQMLVSAGLGELEQVFFKGKAVQDVRKEALNLMEKMQSMQQELKGKAMEALENNEE